MLSMAVIYRAIASKYIYIHQLLPCMVVCFTSGGGGGGSAVSVFDSNVVHMHQGFRGNEMHQMCQATLRSCCIYTHGNTVFIVLSTTKAPSHLLFHAHIHAALSDSHTIHPLSAQQSGAIWGSVAWPRALRMQIGGAGDRTPTFWFVDEPLLHPSR